ncbi:MAG: methionyl-tRNA formyltransferase [Nitrospinota bacterium]|nr:methionyl-tRNA formyltransferase [Nitrospinota bacterium]
MRIVFLGTPDFAVPSLVALQNSSVDIVKVFCQPDRRSGRGRKLFMSSVKKKANSLGLTVEQPERINSRDIQNLEPDLCVVVAYGQILSKKFLDVPKNGVINLHGSLLPRWRGAAPIQRSILHGDEETGVCIIRLTPEMDAGPILAEKKIVMDIRETADTLYEKMSGIGAILLEDTVKKLTSNSLTEKMQDVSKVTFAKKIHKDEAKIDWDTPAVNIERKVRAFRSWPVAESFLSERNDRLRIWDAFVVKSDKDLVASPGTYLGVGDCEFGNGLRVRTAKGDLLLLKIQLSGRKIIDAVDFLKGFPLELGSKFVNRLNSRD